MLSAIIKVSDENIRDRHITQPLGSRKGFHKGEMPELGLERRLWIS